MSIQLIQQYHSKVERLIRYGGTRKETTVRKPFMDLLEQYARPRNLELVPEVEYRTRSGHTVYPDGTLKDALRQDWGYWESKDAADDLDVEIRNKFAKGYPGNNILFEDTQTAVLYQAGEEVARVPFMDAPALDALLTRFVSYESQEVRAFREAIENFSRDIPALAEELRGRIRDQYDTNLKFQKAANDFLELCQEAINPSMDIADVREMIVQHVLTEDIFITVFAEPQFHRENIIAHELGEVVSHFYKGAVRRAIDSRIEGYTMVIKSRAAQIYNHQEKQKFLKVLYENFYKAYNPKAADRLGIVYTPNEIVRFMIEAADHLCHQHFGKTLGDKGVEILDPATGTATFITELIEYLPAHQLEYKYRHELHCNEVAILPYYIANLNIEYTYKQKMGQYVPFENIVFVDTLDNMGFKTQYLRQMGLFGLTDENLERIQRQNQRDISVIIGNPPYNANQLNENENNKNREYPEIDKRIKDTYVKHSTAQKTKLYDMYTRFLRWASDRLGQNGIIAFVSNNSFIDARGYDGFRKVVAEEFNEVYVIDLKGDAYTSGERRQQEGGNVFNDAIRVGVAVYFLIRKDGLDGSRIYYNAIRDYISGEEKKGYLRDNAFAQLDFDLIQPSKQNNWLNLVENNWDDFLPVISKDVKFGRHTEDKAVFRMFSLGVVTARDEWVYAPNAEEVERKVKFLVDVYNQDVERLRGIAEEEVQDHVDYSIKWTRAVKRDLAKGKRYTFDAKQIREGLYRPFFKQKLYFSSNLNEMQYLMPAFFRDINTVIMLSGPNSPKLFTTLATNFVPDFNSLSAAADGCRVMPFYTYDDRGNRVDNITDWALTQFRTHYAQPAAVSFRGVFDEESRTPSPSHASGILRSQSLAQNDTPPPDAPPTTQPAQASPQSSIENRQSSITKESIFHYVYAVLHHPAYRQKYELNLKREFPRIPFYDDFWQWAAWGQELMALHLNYETVEPYPLERHEVEADTNRTAYKAKLKADKTQGIIELDTLTSLSGIPPSAWEYKLGNRSALEWILDRYKESTPKDPTIRDKFNTYRFRDYKEQVIDLLMRVTTVSVRTVAITQAMGE